MEDLLPVKVQKDQATKLAKEALLKGSDEDKHQALWAMLRAFSGHDAKIVDRHLEMKEQIKQQRGS